MTMIRRPAATLGTHASGGLLCAAVAAALALAVPARPAHACGGFAEFGGSCGDAAQDAANEARWMLNRVVTAVRADEPRALTEFSRGADGFRTQDIYVFCVGPDGVMSAHPNPELAGHDAVHLRDSTGKAFIQDMVASAREGQIAEIHYLFPRPGSTVEAPKTTYYTRVKDQVCGVGYYGDSVGADAAQAPAESAAASPAARLADLRGRLDAHMPADLRQDWAAFLKALDEERGSETSALAKARQDVQAAEAALGVGGGLATADH